MRPCCAGCLASSLPLRTPCFFKDLRQILGLGAGLCPRGIQDFGGVGRGAGNGSPGALSPGPGDPHVAVLGQLLETRLLLLKTVRCLDGIAHFQTSGRGDPRAQLLPSIYRATRSNRGMGRSPGECRTGGLSNTVSLLTIEERVTLSPARPCFLSLLFRKLKD